MSNDVYEVPSYDTRSFRTLGSRRIRYIRKDYKCTAIIVLLLILAVTITLSYSLIWFISSNNKAGYNPEIDQRNLNFKNRIQPTSRIRLPKPSQYPFRPGIPGRSNCPGRTIQSHPEPIAKRKHRTPISFSKYT
uniref:Movement protein n=1 Tax=Jingmen Crocidura shantungensis henipavirus 2 TaxID=2928972 RepID=A0AB38ZKE5_9MONO